MNLILFRVKQYLSTLHLVASAFNCNHLFLQLLGELGILKKKHVAVHKDLEDQKQSISSMNSEQSRLENVIKVSSKIFKYYHSHLLITPSLEPLIL